jgi:hypothetical protein
MYISVSNYSLPDRVEVSADGKAKRYYPVFTKTNWLSCPFLPKVLERDDTI